MLNNYSFFSSLILRTPTLPYTLPLTKESALNYLQTPLFREALYLASPDLYHKAIQLSKPESLSPREEQRIVFSLINYINRMRSRCTPYGLFAGCSVIGWGGDHAIIVDERLQRHTRMDMHFLCALAQRIARLPVVQERLLYFPNSSYYYAGEEIRYIEYIYEDGKRIHQTNTVTALPGLVKIMERSHQGLSKNALIQLLREDDIHEEEAGNFIDQLIDAQLIISELEPAVTGPELIYQLIAKVQALHNQKPDEQLLLLIQDLISLEEHLSQLDCRETNPPAVYENIISGLGSWEELMDRSKLFQVDLIKPVLQGQLSTEIQDQLLQALPLLKQLSTKAEPPRLQDFMRHFQERYETAELPLLEVLDPDLGIGYAGLGQSGYAPLTEDLCLPDLVAPKQTPEQRNASEQVLYQKLREAERLQSKVITLSDEDVHPLPAATSELPPTTAIIFRKPTADLLHLEAISGSSAINLLGRFAHASEEIDALLKEIASFEAAQNPDVVFAEIVHLPENRVGNILARPAIRGYEIPYLAQSSLAEEQQIHLQDLRISVRQGRVVLRSQKLNKEVIPRLGTAHNFTNNSLPVYHFLCDLQTQGLQAGINISWMPQNYGTKRLPRLMYKNIILGLATWQLEQEDFAFLFQDDLPTAFEQFCKQWQLPSSFVLADGDRELLIEASQPLTVSAWVDTIRQRKSIILKEYLFDPSASSVKDTRGNPLVNQFIACLKNHQKVYTGLSTKEVIKASSTPERSFVLGSEWLYYKLYCGQFAADTLLSECVAPLVQELLQQHLIDQWFFIRYQDPEAHLRLRFHLRDTNKLGEVIRHLFEAIKSYQDSGLVWKVQTCTYQREIERYGGTTMLLSEELFYQDSMAVLAYLSEGCYALDQDQRWLWGIGMINSLLNHFGYEVSSKQVLLQNLREAFAKEFNMDKALKLQLDQKYRHHRHEISLAMAEQATAGSPLPTAFTDAVASIARQICLLQANKQLEVSLDQLLASYIHMHINRLIPAQQRLHEMVIYDFMARYYQTLVALRKKV